MPETGAAAPSYPVDHKTRRGALRAGAIDAIGPPGLVLAATYLGFGSLVRELGLSVGVGLFSTLTSWAGPGQVALVELFAGGASVVTIFIAVALTNARLMPMTVTLLPILHVPGRRRWKLFLAAHLVAVTGWAVSLLRCPDMPPPQRLSYFVGFAGMLLVASLLGTGAGFYLAGSVPAAVSLGLVFVNPIYFMLMFLGDVRHRARTLALALGAASVLALHLVVPEWDLLLAGVIGGTAAFAIDRLLKRRHA